MQITLKLILDELGYEYESCADSHANPTFECVELLAARGSDLSGRKLLVSSLSEALALPGRSQELYFLCIRDRMVDAQETPEAMRGIIVIRRNLELRELFNEVQRIFVRLSNWIIDMQRSVVENEGMQALITMSEPIIGNHIAVMDPTFKLLAYTKNVETDDPVTNQLVQHGYHPAETVERFKLYRRFEQFEKADGIIVSDDFVTSDYVTVKKVFRYRESYSILVVMVCCARVLSDGLLDLFKLLLNNLQVYVDRDYPPDGEYGPAKALVCDILDGRLDSAEEARDRAAYAALAFRSNYDLFLITFDDTINIPFGRLVRILSTLLPFSHVLTYRQGLLILNRYEGGRLPGREARMTAVDETISTPGAFCGVSTPFSTLMELPTAYEQASVAIRMGARLEERPLVYTQIPNHGKWYYFEDYALFSQLSACLSQSHEGLERTFPFRALQILSEYEKKHNISCLRILHTYLQCERRATETCARLHMHRNTVLYHIKKIEELLGASLDDPEIRLKLLLGFKLRELEQSGHDNAARESLSQPV